MEGIKGKVIRTAVIAIAACAGTGILTVLNQPLIIALGVRTASLLTGAFGIAGGALFVWSAADLAAGAAK